MSASVETITNTTKKQKLNNGSPLSTMSVPNPTPSPAPATTPAPATPAPATTAATTNGVPPPTQAQWAQIPIDPQLQNAQPYPQYSWPPQPTGAPAPVASPAPATTTAATPQPIRAKPSTPAPTTASPAPAGTTATPAPATTTAPYASPYYATAPGYRYPYPYQGQPQYTYAYAQAPGGQYYAVPQPVPQPQQAQAGTTTGTAAPSTGARVVMPTAASASAVAAASSNAQAVAGVGQPVQGQQPTSALNDALAGIVDLRAEEDALARGHQDMGNAYYHREGDRSKRIGPALEQSKIWMSERLKAILSAQGLTNLPEEALNYAMLAWKARLQMLWDKALAAAEHRYSSQYSRPPSFWNLPPTDGTAPSSSVPPTPMWSTAIKRDVAKQLSALERAEKEEETRARRERRTAAAQAEADDAVDDDEDGRKAKKMRALGPGVTARMMPEDVKKKMSDNTANRAAGLGTGKYAWMTAGGAGAGGAASTPVPKPKPVVGAAPAPATGTGTTAAPAAAATPTASSTLAPKTGGWGRAYAAVSKSTAAAEPKDEGVTVTLRDALFVASRERGFGAGRGSALATAGKWE